jgi:hypothetical protein
VRRIKEGGQATAPRKGFAARQRFSQRGGVRFRREAVWSGIEGRETVEPKNSQGKGTAVWSGHSFSIVCKNIWLRNGSLPCRFTVGPGLFLSVG